MKKFVQSVLARTPYKLVRRTQLNRFQAIDETLKSLKRRGFSPATVVDCGANVGAFARDSLQLFPGSIVHAIEPQPGCVPELESLSRSFPQRLILHRLALSSPDLDGAMLSISTDAASISTGAHVVATGAGLSVPCTTLDSLLSPYKESLEGALLKLDLQGYELHALTGATTTLDAIDVVLTEVSFYAQDFEPPISELVGFLADHRFELYDVASIYARPRDDRPRQADFVFIRKNSPMVADKAWS